nr:hypothetical protein [Streptomyces sp. CB02366]
MILDGTMPSIEPCADPSNTYAAGTAVTIALTPRSATSANVS